MKSQDTQPHPRRRDILAAAGGASSLWATALEAQEPGELSSEKIKIGQIGTKHPHAHGKFAAIRKYPDTFEFVGVVEPDEQQWTRVKTRYQEVRRISEESLFKTAGLAAVAVETDIPELVSTAQRCVAEGLHVHLDKPAGLDVKSFAKAQEVAERNKVYIQLGYMYRYNPAFLYLYKLVDEGVLGEIFQVDAVMSKLSNDSGRLPLQPYSGGVMFELACHLVDAVIAILGQPQVVHSHLRKTFPERDQVVDHALAVLEYPKALATVRSSLVEVDGFRRRQLVVCGTKGTAIIRPLEPPQLEVTLREGSGSLKKGANKIDLQPSPGRYDEEFMDLARIIRGQKAPTYSAAHDLAVQETLLRAASMYSET